MKLKLSNFVLSVIEEVHKELNSRGFIFQPKYYISDVWGCPNKVPLIGIPYSFCYPIFKPFENDGVIVQKEPILKIVRHEVGHALNYAYKLYRIPLWEKNFGNFNKPYNLDEAVKYANPYSKDFVVNLPDYNYCYSQLHPDEDFAETFAVWLSTSFPNLFSLYKDKTKALKKLLHVDFLMSKIMKKEPLILGGRKHKPYSSIILKGR